MVSSSRKDSSRNFLSIYPHPKIKTFQSQRWKHLAITPSINRPISPQQPPQTHPIWQQIHSRIVLVEIIGSSFLSSAAKSRQNRDPDLPKLPQENHPPPHKIHRLHTWQGPFHSFSARSKSTPGSLFFHLRFSPPPTTRHEDPPSRLQRR